MTETPYIIKCRMIAKINQSIIGISKEITNRRSILWHVKKSLLKKKDESLSYGNPAVSYTCGIKALNEIKKLKIIKAELYLCLYRIEAQLKH